MVIRSVTAIPSRAVITKASPGKSGQSVSPAPSKPFGSPRAHAGYPPSPLRFAAEPSPRIRLFSQNETIAVNQPNRFQLEIDLDGDLPPEYGFEAHVFTTAPGNFKEGQTTKLEDGPQPLTVNSVQVPLAHDKSGGKNMVKGSVEFTPKEAGTHQVNFLVYVVTKPPLNTYREPYTQINATMDVKQ